MTMAVIDSTSEVSASNEAEKKLFIGQLPFNVSEKTLEAEFGQFGKVEEAIIVRERRQDDVGFMGPMHG